MSRYLFCYQTLVTFSKPVAAHAVLLRCQPVNTRCQQIEEQHLLLPPDFAFRHSTDGFGNRIVYGCQREPHCTLAYVSTGIVQLTPYTVERGAEPIAIYRQPTALTTLAEPVTVRDFGDPIETALYICHQVHDVLDYMPQTTDVETTAEEVWKKRCGVCQDYAHLMLAVCRQKGIPARYVCGFVAGTGETHAWVEVFDGYAWVGFDPTHDLRIQLGYVKLAHGRDVSDCPVSRGVYQGDAIQQTSVNVMLQEI